MTIDEETITQTVTLTQPAADAVRDVMAKKNLQGYALRLFISGGGCSGYQYGLAFDNNIRTEDLVIETDGIKLVIDEVSIQYLNGATVDYVDGLTRSGFKSLTQCGYILWLWSEFNSLKEIQTVVVQAADNRRPFMKASETS
jgi:iron-sulfur cluster assembly accessory protein